MNVESHYLKKELYEQIQKDVSVFEFLQNGSLDGIWYWDLENPENEWMSDRFWTILGYDPAEKKHLASEWQGLIHPDDLQVAFSNFKKHCEDPNHPYDQVVRYQHKDGSTVWIRCRGIAIRDTTGKPIR
jgi:PAS domain S-box-containing protein